MSNLLFIATLIIVSIQTVLSKVQRNLDGSGEIETKKTFVIKLGTLNTIYHRSENDLCDYTKMYAYSVQVS